MSRTLEEFRAALADYETQAMVYGATTADLPLLVAARERVVDLFLAPAPSTTRAPGGDRLLARNQPCGCVVCRCEDEERCSGCGAKNCGTHPVGEIPNPVYASASPVLPEERGTGCAAHAARPNGYCSECIALGTPLAPAAPETPATGRCRCGAMVMPGPGWARYDGHTAAWTEDSYPGCAPASPVLPEERGTGTITLTFAGAGPCPTCGGPAAGVRCMATPGVAFSASGTWISPGERTVYRCANRHEWPNAAPPPAAPETPARVELRSAEFDAPRTPEERAARRAPSPGATRGDGGTEP